MEKSKLLEKYEKEEDRLLLAKLLDKIEMVKQRNRIMTTDFLDLAQVKLIEEGLLSTKQDNCLFWGGVKEAERKILILYPQKLQLHTIEDIKQPNQLINAIRIVLPNHEKGTYTHKVYLGGIMKLGIKREKIGDILVQDLGADILVKPEMAEYVIDHLKQLTRFQKSKIEKIPLDKVEQVQIKKEEIRIIVASLRLDSILAELLHVSRKKAIDFMLEERVFLNFKNEKKASKEIKIGDIITIRGKGRFQIKSQIGRTKSDRIIISVEKNT